jgi:putative ABC transport system substrate-binding protein
MFRSVMSNRPRFRVAIPAIAVLLTLFAPPCRAAEVVIVGDTQLRPVTEIIGGIRRTLNASYKTYSPDEVKGRLDSVVERERARVVVALGREALAEALRLPPSIAVVFDLVVTPPVISRPNTTGFYLATPVREYADLVRNHLHTIRQMAVVGSRGQQNTLAWGGSPAVSLSTFNVRDSVDFVATIKQLGEADAILLLPDTGILTPTAMDEAYLYSFRKGIPLLGISERHVKEGALLALVVDMVHVGRLIGEYAGKAARGANIGQIPPSPPRKFDVYLNTATARRMGIPIPNELVRLAKRVYP